MFRKTLTAVFGLILIVPAAAQPALTPAGAFNLCRDYPWACSAAGGGVRDAGIILDHARTVNREVNASIRQRTDRALYGAAEKWVLPESAGDCEDLALLKMRKLIDRGVPPRNLRLAQVMKRKVPSHVVLLVETVPGTEYVLDSLSGQVAPRPASSYIFLKQQSRGNPAQWEAAI